MPDEIIEDAKKLGKKVKKRAEQKLKEMQSNAELEEKKVELEQYIVDHPLESIAMAAGLGLLVGMLMSK